MNAYGGILNPKSVLTVLRCEIKGYFFQNRNNPAISVFDIDFTNEGVFSLVGFNRSAV